jgi:uncharacterized membrane protein
MKSMTPMMTMNQPAKTIQPVHAFRSISFLLLVALSGNHPMRVMAGKAAAAMLLAGPDGGDGKDRVMATLVAIAYPDETTAEQARHTVQGLERDLVIQADQVAAISRDAEGKYHVTTTHGGASTAGGAVWGGFWGFLFGLIFFIPIAGLAVGAGLGALFGHLGENAVDREFQDQVRDKVQPGTSALFMIIEQATPDKAIAALKQYGGTVIRTSLSEDDTAKLQAALNPSATAGAR